jgi:UDP-GlcNAc3NAcA epimerase
MKLLHVVGARPQFIKMAAVSRAVAEHNQDLDPGQQLQGLIIHTGQHYDYELSKLFFEELHLPKPDL